ncbi:PKD domain-containing protein [Chitinophaga arvensicola]|uniref:Por secretion system C-terminal sorting domain-containing protein n=1 Tax=Chitinophaga arvensicola TaxID=29529 RepID=A0A1I0S5F6_9BACT|nr:PKD domain-containing protein [Chitinophaga arvensicola]SEW50287.1 Por secretion system C-terminal sorting domain-containing protein [Chitinophaga arvensicola]
MKNRLLINGLALFVLMLTWSSAIYAQGDQTAISVKLSASESNGAWLHLPDDYNSTSDRYPLLVFLHGVGEKGTGSDINKVLAWGVPKMISQGAKMQFTVNGKLFKFITVSPQIPGGFCSADQMENILADIQARYRVDANRIYITGLSAGGYGTWNYVARDVKYSNKIAAIVPVSAAPIDKPVEPGLCNIATSKVAVWDICGSADAFFQYVEPYINQINNTCNAPIKAISTTVAGAGHNGDTWDRAYDVTNKYYTPNIYEWMLQYSKDGAVNPPVNTPPTVKLASTSIALTLPSNTTTLDGSASSAASGNTIKTYQWKAISGPAATINGATLAKATLQNLVAGTYVYELAVTDNNNMTATARVTVTVAAAPAAGGCAGCKFTISPGTDGGAYIDGGAMGFKPGDTVCVKAGNYTYMQFYNFSGAAGKPVVFINCGGVVQVGSGGSYGIVFNNAKYFKITGSGSSDQYGFKIDGGAAYLNAGLGIGVGCTDYEGEKIEVTHTDVGILAKINPTCDPTTQYPNFSIRNVSFHDLYIHNTRGEGMYIGNTASAGEVITGCPAGNINVIPPRIYNLKIYNVITDGTGWDGIQVASAPQNVEIYNNRVSNFGVQNLNSQQAGIILGGASNGSVHHNVIIKGTGNGIEVFGQGLCKVYNNVVVNTGQDGTAEGQDAIFADDRPTPAEYVPLYVYMVNNTVVGSGRDGIRLLSTYGTLAKGNIIANNFVVASGPRGSASGISVMPGVDWSNQTNISATTVAAALFKDPANNDYHLQATSPAVDKGTDLTSIGITTDLDGNPRPYNKIFDAGAYEYSGNAPVNKPPVANAGSNITIALPTNTVQLDGSASSDPDGSIAAYKWTKVSGPDGAVIVSDAAAKTAVNNLVQGVYVFELTVTDNIGASATSRVTVTVNAAPPANKPPVANAGSNVTITLPTNTVSLDGSASSDPDGSVTAFQWTQVSGPSTAVLSTPAAAKTNATQLVAGTYIFELKVTDNSDATATARVTITVNAAPVNQLPVANAGSNVTITLPANTVQLDGSASSDPDGSITAFKWTQVSGPANATLSAATSAKTTASQLVAGTYIFELQVTDNSNATATARVTVTVNSAVPANKPPIADAGANITITLPVSTAQLNGSGSTDPDGTITAYQWSQVSGPGNAVISTPTAVRANISQLVAGTYIFELQVTDNSNATSKARVTVTVNQAIPSNQPPVANAGANITITLPVSTAQLNGSGSTDPDGTIAAYQWSQVSGPNNAVISTPAAVRTNISQLVAGTYIFQLQVADNLGATATARVTVTVNNASPSNQSPVAIAGNDQKVVLSDELVLLNGSASYDPDGTIVAYRWELISGSSSATITNATNARAFAHFTEGGVYVFRLTVTDNDNAISQSQVTLTVMNGDNHDTDIRVYPNPATQVLRLTASAAFNEGLPLNLFIYHVSGRIAKNIYIGNPRDWTRTIDIHDLPVGMYLLKITDSRQLNVIRKFIKVDF